jgi:hypothetical protein
MGSTLAKAPYSAKTKLDSPMDDVCSSAGRRPNPSNQLLPDRYAAIIKGDDPQRVYGAEGIPAENIYAESFTRRAFMRRKLTMNARAQF